MGFKPSCFLQRNFVGFWVLIVGHNAWGGVYCKIVSCPLLRAFMWVFCLPLVWEPLSLLVLFSFSEIVPYIAVVSVSLEEEVPSGSFYTVILNWNPQMGFNSHLYSKCLWENYQPLCLFPHLCTGNSSAYSQLLWTLNRFKLNKWISWHLKFTSLGAVAEPCPPPCLDSLYLAEWKRDIQGGPASS